MKHHPPSLLISLIILILLSFSSTAGFAQNAKEQPWELVKEKGALKVYTRKNMDSEIKELRMTTNIKAPLSTFITALNDANGYTDWVYKCQSSKVLKSISASEMFYRVEMDFPFPMSNRDIVIFTKCEIDDAGVFYSESKAYPDIEPEVKGVVRIDLFETHWIVKQQNDGSLDVEYFSKVDPAGNIPLWVVNIGLTIGPIKTMENLTELVLQKSF